MHTKHLSFFFLSLFLSSQIGCTEKAAPKAMSHREDAVGILGGKILERKESDLRHEVMILNLKSNNVCSATVVAKSVILTAAHCVTEEAKDILIFFDDKPLADNSTAEGVPADSIEIHPDYLGSANIQSTDLALVFMAEPIPTTHHAIGISHDNVQLEQKISITGYGKVSENEDSEVGHLYHAEGLVTVASPFFFSIDQTSGVGICDGDSGGPAYAEMDGKLFLVGVAKMVYSEDGESQSACAETGQFTSVTSSEVRDWISQKIIEKRN